MILSRLLYATGKSSPKVKIIIDLHGKWANLMRRDDQKNGQCHSEIRPACHANIAGSDGSGQSPCFLEGLAPHFWRRAQVRAEGGQSLTFWIGPSWVLVLKAIKSPSPEFIKGLKPWPGHSQTFKTHVYRAQPIPNCRSHNEKSSCYWWGLGN